MLSKCVTFNVFLKVYQFLGIHLLYSSAMRLIRSILALAGKGIEEVSNQGSKQQNCLILLDVNCATTLWPFRPCSRPEILIIIRPFIRIAS